MAYRMSDYSWQTLMSTADVYAGMVHMLEEPLEGPNFELPEGFKDLEPEVQVMIVQSSGVQRAPSVVTRAGIGLLGDPVSDSIM